MSKSDFFNPKIVIKSIVNPEKVKSIFHPHGHLYKNNELAVNEDFEEIPVEKLWSMNGAHIKKIRLNHYYTKSVEEYEEKLKKSYADQDNSREYNEKRLYFDDGIQDYVDTYIPFSLDMILTEKEDVRVVYNIPQKLTAPIEHNEEVGMVYIYIDNELFRAFSILAQNDVPVKDFSWHLDALIKEILF